MLANGTKLGYSTTSGGSYTDLAGLKEIPDMGVEAERVENTCLTDKNKRYEQGIGDLGDMTYKFRYENSGASSAYRVMRGYSDSKEVLYFQETAPDGTKCTFSGTVSVKRIGGGVNTAIDFDLAIAVESDLTFTDPA